MQQLQRGWLVTSEHENNAPFPKPWGPQTGGALVGVCVCGGGCGGTGLLSLQATQLPITFIIWEEGEEGRAKERRRKERRRG